MSQFTTNVIMLNSVSSTVTSSAFDVSDRSKMSVELVVANATGSGTFTFEVSDDMTNYVAYNRIISNVIDTSSETDTKVSSLTLDETTTKLVALFPTNDYFRYLRTTFTSLDGAIVTSSISDGGTGYSVNDVLTVDDGTGGTITVLTVNGMGVVLTYSLTTAGTDYTVDVHTTSYGGAGTGFELSVDSVDPGDYTATLQTQS